MIFDQETARRRRHLSIPAPVFLMALLLPLFIGPLSRAAANAEAQFSRALELYRSEQFAESAGILESLTRQNPSRALYWFNLAGAYYRLGRYPQALQAYRKVPGLGSPLEDAAWFYIAEICNKQGDRREATRVLRYLKTRPLPPNLAEAVASFLGEFGSPPPTPQLERVIRSYEAGNFADALKALNTVVRTQPSGNAYFLRGLTQLRLRDPSGARLSFEKALVSPEIESSLSNDAQSFIRQIRDGAWDLEQPFQGSLDSWAGWNSNVFSNGQSETQTGLPIAHLGAALRYWITGTAPSSFLAEYRPSWDEVVSLPSDRLISNQFRLQAGQASGDFFAALSPRIEHEILGSSNYLLRPAVQLRAETRWGAHVFGASGDLLRNLSLQPGFDYLAGNVLEARAYWNHFSTSAEYFAFFSLGREAIGDEVFDLGTLPLANRSLGGGAGVTLFLTSTVDGTVSASYFHKSFDQASTYDGLLRVDDLVSATLSFSQQLAPSWRLLAGLTLNQNFSTLGSSSIEDLNYQQWIATAGLSWRFFP